MNADRPDARAAAAAAADGADAVDDSRRLMRQPLRQRPIAAAAAAVDS